MNLIEKLKQNKVFPIIRSNDPQDVVNKVKALLDGGLDIMEVNVETPQIFNAIRAVSKDAIICAGGIITSIQAQTAIECGARILSSPIFQSNLLKISKDKHLPLIAGTSTANEAYNAWKSRIPAVKINPVTALGGAEYIENLLRPMPFLNVIPQGNVQLSEIQGYIKAGAIAVGVGRHLTGFDSYKEITKVTKELLENLK
jgi:2-dehydro-3-deoxyphosphogluconate aldolase/(4S)-4-hydroxy-2-oxoglutarate aldolase